MFHEKGKSKEYTCQKCLSSGRMGHENLEQQSPTPLLKNIVLTNPITNHCMNDFGLPSSVQLSQGCQKDFL